MEIFCYDSRHYIKNIRLAMDKFDVAQNNEEVSKARQEVVDSVNLYSKIRLLNEKQRASTCWLF